MFTKGVVYGLDIKTVPVGIKTAIKEVFGATMHTIRSKDRHQNIAGMRAVVMVYLKRNYPLTYDDVGFLVTRSRHNIMHFDKAHDGRMECDRDYKASYEALEEAMK